MHYICFSITTDAYSSTSPLSDAHLPSSRYYKKVLYKAYCSSRQVHLKPSRNGMNVSFLQGDSSYIFCTPNPPVSGHACSATCEPQNWLIVLVNTNVPSTGNLNLERSTSSVVPLRSSIRRAKISISDECEEEEANLAAHLLLQSLGRAVPLPMCPFFLVRPHLFGIVKGIAAKILPIKRAGPSIILNLNSICPTMS